MTSVTSTTTVTTVPTIPVQASGKWVNMALEGGGVLGVAYVGALQQMYENGSINDIKNFAGSSVGALFALMLSCKISFDFMADTIVSLDFNSFKDGSLISDVVRLKDHYGYYAGDALLAFLKTTIKTVTGLDDPTFMDIYKKYGTSLIITSSNVTKCRLEYFTKETHPDMSACLACRLSASIPLFFQSLKYKSASESNADGGDNYVDGGLSNNYPINFFTNNTNYSGSTIGLKVVSQYSIKESHGTLGPITGIEDFITRIVEMMNTQALKIYIEPGDWDKTVKIYTGTISPLNFSLTTADKMYLIQQGVAGMKTYLTNQISLSTSGGMDDPSVNCGV